MEARLAQKQVKVRYKRTMGIGRDKRSPGYETMMDEGQAQAWAANGRIEIIASGKEKARPRAGAADPTPAPPSGSPAGPGALSSSSLPARPRAKKTSRKPAASPAHDAFG
jgi:hypothetical protein